MLHNYNYQTLRGLNTTTPAYRANLIAILRELQELEGKGANKPAPSIVRYCTTVLAPYVQAHERSRCTWEGLRAFEEDEARYRKPYVAGFATEAWKKRMSRAWAA